MKNLQDLISRLQKQPYETRVKILWGTVSVIGVILLVVWIFNLKSTIKQGDVSSIINQVDNKSEPQTQATGSYANIERAELSDNSLKLYFNFNNTTGDILNIPKLFDITLGFKDQKINPTQMTDRQGQSFVQKVLSHSQTFGILSFPKIDSDTAELIFDQMFFETTPDKIFMQKIKLNLKDLIKNTKVRN